ncbi:MAG: hypothetical protein A2639_03035 [Candidatus Staskawiczbacteria bacterium RIFCSPHIGHO2_01_FULL_34_27]|uniref:Glycosyl transferase family 28 C-terminal domain-containing protein n=1 Tax=Candidatus Staskawiczbacteria bacterium RIFCSPHIGHO2_01_FULL_34_27 TaxID=1802199 RepID=A0A1G2HKY6_9BACT|nr:MAG: hypothetical protein A2639_03035 [Candidatus Staskawiczbacteria bacterium RIFCSPHIGHO2_01_FULL_34_27]
MNNKKNILIISMSSGFGHIRAGEALLNYSKENLLNVNIDHFNVSNAGLFMRKYDIAYSNIVKKAPFLWRIMYKYFPVFIINNNFFLEGFFNKAIKNYIIEKKPDSLIFTNVFAIPMVGYFFKKKFPNAKIGVVVTDYHGHQFYKQSLVDYYFVANLNVKEDLKKIGVKEEKIIITGIPVDVKFYIKQNVKDLKTKYGINNDLSVVLFFATFKISDKDLIETIEGLINFEPKINLIFVSSGNEKLYKLISDQFKNKERLFTVNWTDKIDEYMKVSDVIIGKAGGLTVSECLVLKKPMIIINPIPGQEEHNADFIEKNNFGKKVKNADEIFNILPEMISGKTYNFDSIETENPSKKILKYFA